MFRKKWVWALIVLIVIVGGAASYFVRRRDEGVAVATESIYKRDLESIVSASGKIDPEKDREHQRADDGTGDASRGQGRRSRQGRSVPPADRSDRRRERRAARRSGRRRGANRPRAGAGLAQELAGESRPGAARISNASRISGPAASRPARRWSGPQAELDVRESDLNARRQEIRTRRRAGAAAAGGPHEQPALAGAVALRVAVRWHRHAAQRGRRRERGRRDDEQRRHGASHGCRHVGDRSRKSRSMKPTSRSCGSDRPAKVTIDAIEGKTFTGHVTEIGNSPIQAAGPPTGGARTATNFKVVVTLEGEVPEVRPGFTCTAEITTDTPAQAVAVPIQAVTVRELLYDDKGNVIHEPRPPKPAASASARTSRRRSRPRRRPS